MKLADIALSNLLRRKGRVLILLLAMAVGSGTIIALFAVTNAMNEEVSHKFDQIGSNLVIMPKSEALTLSYGGISVGGDPEETTELSQDVIGRILSIKNAENIATIAPKLLGTLVTGDETVLAVGVDFRAELRMKKWWNIEGRAPTEANEVVLGSAAAARLEKGSGSTISAAGRELTVVGVLEEMGTEEDNALFLDLALLQGILGKPQRLSFVELSALCYTCPIEDISAQLAGKLPEAKVTTILEAVSARKTIVDRFSALARAVALTVLVISAMIIASAVMSSVNQRSREIGILRAIGFRRAHVATIILLEVTAVSAAAGGIGFLLGTLSARGLAPLVAQMEVTVAWDWKLGAAALALTVLTAVAASLVPALTAAGEDPADALRHI